MKPRKINVSRYNCLLSVEQVLRGQCFLSLAAYTLNWPLTNGGTDVTVAYNMGTYILKSRMSRYTLFIQKARTQNLLYSKASGIAYITIRA